MPHPKSSKAGSPKANSPKTSHRSQPIQLPPTIPNELEADCQQWQELLATVNWQETLGWQPDDTLIGKFQALYEAVILGNRQLNLTRLTDPPDFWEKHLWDSLRGLQSLGDWSDIGNESINAIDIGTGAGFPGFPAAIAFPHWSVTLLDSTQRKVAFLEQAIERMQLDNARALASRVELLPQRELYDVATLRAIGPASVCAEYCMPLLKIGGKALLYRGRWTVEEEAALWSAMEVLGGEVAAVDAFTTPVSDSIRHCIVLSKTDSTPDSFPRAPGIASRNPLGNAE